MNLVPQSVIAVPGRWLKDDRLHVAMAVFLPAAAITLTVSLTALELARRSTCSLRVAYDSPDKWLEYVTSVKVTQGASLTDELDLAAVLLQHLTSPAFCSQVLPGFLAEMSRRGMRGKPEQARPNA